jgi:hypothetical protein
MNPRLSRHAISEARPREIPLDLPESVIARPEQIVILGATLAVYQSRTTDPAGKVYLIRAIVSTVETPGTVVTVYRTSKIQKYWRSE